MRIKPLYLLNIVLAVTLLTSLFAYAAVNRNTTADLPEYNAWSDLNDDGTIDIFDIVDVAAYFGTSGDPAKNVIIQGLSTKEWEIGFNLLPSQSNSTSNLTRGYRQISIGFFGLVGLGTASVAVRFAPYELGPAYTVEQFTVLQGSRVLKTYAIQGAVVYVDLTNTSGANILLVIDFYLTT